MKTREKISIKIAIDRLMKLCSQAEKSSFDIKKKLQDWGLGNDAESILNHLTKDRFIDDQRFAIAFAKDKIFFNKWGTYKVRYLLQDKQISKESINNAIAEIDIDDYKKMVFSELSKKQRSLKINDQFKQKSKIYVFGSQRGYERELINEYFESVSRS